MIFPLQGDFIQGRDIHDNIVIPHQILNSFFKKHKKEGQIAVKADM